MKVVEALLDQMKHNPKSVRFQDLCKVCEHYFGKHHQGGTSYRVYKMPWKGDPRVNIQNDKGRAKAYQVKQVVFAINRWEEEHHGSQE